jgi:hypothetical protein
MIVKRLRCKNRGYIGINNKGRGFNVKLLDLIDLGFIFE